MDFEATTKLIYEATKAINDLVGQPTGEYNKANYTGLLYCRTAKEMHESWLAQRSKDGWVYGKVKDVEKKISPSLIPWDNVSQIDQIKGVVAMAISEACLVMSKESENENEKV